MQNFLIVAVMAFGVTGEVAVFGIVGQAAAKTSGAPTKKVFHGHGAMLDLHGTELSTYDIELVRTKTEPNIVDQTIRVLLPKGEVKEFSQHIERQAQSLRITSSQGVGYGTDLGEGVITTYQPLADGSAYAQTIMIGADDSMRILRTELRDGSAVHFFREAYKAE
jgi:hypothetical protein